MGTMMERITPENDRATDVATMLDKAAITETTARFADACNTRDIAAFRALWLPDGVWEIGEPFPARAEGVDDIANLCQTLLGLWEVFVQFTHSGVIEIDGDTAIARWTMQETASSPEADRFYNNFGLYEDTLLRVDGKWLFKHRRYHYMYMDGSPLAGQIPALAPTFTFSR